MPPYKDVDCHHNGQKLEASKIRFVRRKGLLQTLCSFSKPKDRSQVYCKGCHKGCSGIGFELMGRHMSRAPDEGDIYDDEDEEREDLEG